MKGLKVTDLSIKFGGIKALNGVSLEVAPGSFVGLMGPNGAGKTTVINCVSRILDPTGGTMEFDGHDLGKLRGDQVRRIGISRTFQDLDFLSHIDGMSVLDYLRLGQFDPYRTFVHGDGLRLPSAVRYDRELKRNARRVLSFFHEIRDMMETSEEERQHPFLLGREGFPDLLDVQFQPLRILSFAWRRRLDLARALVSNPRLILLDEPAQGLPPTEIENLGRMLRLIQKEFRVSALIVEHNVATLMKISDRVIVMNYGEKIADGSPEEVGRDRKVIEIYLGAPSKPEAAAPERTVVSGGTPAARPAPVPAGPPLLEVRDLNVHYGFAQALFQVSIQVQASQVVSILGTNGSGKSTLLRAISGVEKPSAGEILYKGMPIPLGWPELAVERGIQYVPQGHVIFPELSVLDNLRVGAYAFEKRGLKLKEGLERVFYYFPDLRNFLSVQAASLSGGQQQMLAIAQAVIGRPGVLLLDEPSLGLSPLLVETLFRIIKKISAEEGCSILIVEQSVQKALEISDHLFLLSSGVVIAQGPAAQFREDDATIQRYLGFH